MEEDKEEEEEEKFIYVTLHANMYIFFVKINNIIRKELNNISLINTINNFEVGFHSSSCLGY